MTVAASTPGMDRDALERRPEDLVLSRDQPRSLFEADQDDVGQAHAEVLRHQVVETAAEHARAGDQHDRQRRLHQQQHRVGAAAMRV